LMSCRMPGCRHDPDARDEFDLSLDLLVQRAGEVHQLRNRVLRLPSAGQFRRLHHDRTAGKSGVPAAVVEVEVAVDDPTDVPDVGADPRDRLGQRSPAILERKAAHVVCDVRAAAQVLHWLNILDLL
jgi:hypothetical protein